MALQDPSAWWLSRKHFGLHTALDLETGWETAVFHSDRWHQPSAGRLSILLITQVPHPQAALLFHLWELHGEWLPICASARFLGSTVFGLTSHAGSYIYLTTVSTWSQPLWNLLTPVGTREPRSMVASPASTELLKDASDLLPRAFLTAFMEEGKTVSRCPCQEFSPKS